MTRMDPKLRDATREISYSHAAESKAGRALIRTVENLTGRVSLIRRAKGYELEVAEGRDFWQVMVDRYRLQLEVIGGALENIPREGPLIVISNHPYGILDGLMMGHILSNRRDEFRILAHQVFKRAEELNRIILPVSFSETKAAMKLNLETRRVCMEFLKSGGALGVFPGGTVSTAVRPFGRPLDPGWRTFTAKLIAKSGATVVPIFFDGHNSRLFQVASHMHANLRVALLINEFRRRVGDRVSVVIGAPLDPGRIVEEGRDPRGLMDYLRAETYKLSPRPVAHEEFGFEFEEHHRRH